MANEVKPDPRMEGAEPRSDEWATPQGLFDLLNAEFHFTLDACANESNAKCPVFFTKEQDAFTITLARPQTVWMNPPFSRIAEALTWARQQCEFGKSTFAVLVPTRTNPPWWHEHVMMASEIRFIRKKVSFVPPDKSKSGVPFTGHAIVVFRPDDYGRKIISQRQ